MMYTEKSTHKNYFRRELGLLLQMSTVHYVISNFNTIPMDLMESSPAFTLYDQSDDESVLQKLISLNDPRIIFCGKSKGHNLLNYLDFIIDNYEELPATLILTKGNMPGRHCDAEWYRQALLRQDYEFLWNDDDLTESPDKFLKLAPGRFAEINTSWWVSETPHRYFLSTDEFLKFIFKNYVRSKYILFSPGGCYLVSRDRIRRNPKSLYQGLKTLIEYDFRTAECFMLERSLNLIFDRTHILQDYIFDLDEFLLKIRELPDVSFAKKLSLPKGRLDHFLWLVHRYTQATMENRSKRRNEFQSM